MINYGLVFWSRIFTLVVVQTSIWQTWHYCIALGPGLTWLHLGRLEHRVETQGQPGSEYCLARKNEANNCHIFSCKQSSLDILQNVTLRTRVHNRLGQTTGQGTVEVLKVSVVVKPGSKCDQLLDVGLHCSQVFVFTMWCWFYQYSDRKWLPSRRFKCSKVNRSNK